MKKTLKTQNTPSSPVQFFLPLWLWGKLLKFDPLMKQIKEWDRILELSAVARQGRYRFFMVCFFHYPYTKYSGFCNRTFSPSLRHCFAWHTWTAPQPPKQYFSDMSIRTSLKKLRLKGVCVCVNFKNRVRGERKDARLAQCNQKQKKRYLSLKWCPEGIKLY